MAYSELAYYGKFFKRQGRPDFPLSGCVILCITTYKVKGSKETRRIETLENSYSLSIHAEESILCEIEKTEQENHL
jgi:hypothetical protein